MTGTPWHLGRLAAFDTESSGTNVEEDRIVSASISLVGGGQPTHTVNWLAAVDVDIPEAASAVHGITTEHAREHGKPPRDVISEIATALADAAAAGIPVVGHNAPFDQTILDRELRRHNLPTLAERLDGTPLHVLDSLVCDKHVLPFRRRISDKQGPRQLVTCARVYELTWDEEAAHGADYDALMAARVLYRIGQIAHTPRHERPDWVLAERSQRFDDLAGLSLEELHQAQVEWAAEDAESFQEWLRTKAPDGKRDPNAVIDGSWPIRPWAGETS